MGPGFDDSYYYDYHGPGNFNHFNSAITSNNQNNTTYDDSQIADQSAGIINEIERGQLGQDRLEMGFPNPHNESESEANTTIQNAAENSNEWTTQPTTDTQNSDSQNDTNNTSHNNTITNTTTTTNNTTTTTESTDNTPTDTSNINNTWQTFYSGTESADSFLGQLTASQLEHFENLRNIRNANNNNNTETTAINNLTIESGVLAGIFNSQNTMTGIEDRYDEEEVSSVASGHESDETLVPEEGRGISIADFGFQDAFDIDEILGF